MNINYKSNEYGLIGKYGWDRSGKTLTAVADSVWLVQNRGRELVSNVKIYGIPGTYLDTDGMMNFVLNMRKKRLKDLVILIDEIDYVLPGRLFNDKEQIKAVNSFAWQLAKRRSACIYTAHRGRGCDAIIRLATHIMHICEHDEANDKIDIIQCDLRSGSPDCRKIFPNASFWFDKYETEENII